MTTIPTTARNATAAEIVDILEQQNAARYDVVAAASQLSYAGGQLVLGGTSEPVLIESGVDTQETRLTPTAIFDEQLASRLEIPTRYMRRLRAEDVNLLDTNVNRWLGADKRKFMIRGFKVTGDSGSGVARCVMSDRFGATDHLDSLMAMFAGAREAGVQIEVVSADLSERALRVKIRAPQISVLAPELLRNYRSPYSGNTGAENPTVFAGFEFANSETGHGAYSVTPRLIVEICTNGMTLTKDAYRKVHLGSKQGEGRIEWSDATNKMRLELIQSETKDAVAKFLDVDWMRAKIDEINGHAHTEIDDAPKAIEVVAKKLSFTAEEQNLILNDFIKGGQTTSGGVLQAITAAAQRLEDPDRAAHLEASALDAMLVLA